VAQGNSKGTGPLIIGDSEDITYADIKGSEGDRRGKGREEKGTEGEGRKLWVRGGRKNRGKGKVGKLGAHAKSCCCPVLLF